jgi:hypothetical protein
VTPPALLATCATVLLCLPASVSDNKLAWGVPQPVFLSKKQREELALKKREEDVKAQRAKADEMRKAHETYVETVRKQERDAAAKREKDRRAEDDRKKREEARILSFRLPDRPSVCQTQLLLTQLALDSSLWLRHFLQ